MKWFNIERSEFNRLMANLEDGERLERILNTRPDQVLVALWSEFGYMSNYPHVYANVFDEEAVTLGEFLETMEEEMWRDIEKDVAREYEIWNVVPDFSLVRPVRARLRFDRVEGVNALAMARSFYRENVHVILHEENRLWVEAPDYATLMFALCGIASESEQSTESLCVCESIKNIDDFWY